MRCAQARKEYNLCALFRQVAQLISMIGSELPEDCEGPIVDFFVKLDGQMAEDACAEGVERLGATPELPGTIRRWLILEAPGHVPAKIISGAVAIPAGEIEEAAAVGSPQTLLAIAARPGLTARAGELLSLRGDGHVLSTLLDNPDAVIDEVTQKIIKRRARYIRALGGRLPEKG